MDKVYTLLTILLHCPSDDNVPWRLSTFSITCVGPQIAHQRTLMYIVFAQRLL